MKKASHVRWFLAVLTSAALVLPAPLWAQQGQSAGTISRLIPNVNLQHGLRVQLANPGAKVVWGDTIQTDTNGRARISLDDGSILNVGSNSNLRVVQHDAANQRTQVQLAYGRLRASAIRLARPGASFEVRTPTAVAGVVGTEFDLTFSNDITTLSVTEGSVNFCNRTGTCVVVAAGFTSAIRDGDPPSQPVPTPPSTATENVNSTSLQGGAGGGAAVGTAAGVSHSFLILATVIGAVIVPAIVVPVESSGTKCGCSTVLSGKGGPVAHP